MNNLSKKKINIIESIKNNKKVQYALIIVLSILAVIIFLFSSIDFSDNNSNDQVSEYVSALENKLEKTLSKVDGVGNVSVIISIESGMETVLANKTSKTQTENGLETHEEPLVINGKTVVLKEKYPKITGVLIVAEGADKISVITKIQQATMSLLEIEAGQIEILKMKE